MNFKTSDLKAKTFSEMNLSPFLIGALGRMAITKPTDIQSQAIPVISQGHNLIAIAQTGSGKTLAYALSALSELEKKPEARMLVMAPSREMAQQIYKVITELCFNEPMSSCLVIGGLPGDKQTSQLKKNPKIIVATPGRLNDHLITNKLLLQKVEYVIIDEADRMLDMGFAPQLKSIQNTMRGNWKTLMFSASFGQPVEAIAELFMKETPVMIKTENAEAPVETLRQKVLFLDRSMKNDRLLEELNSTKGGVIVFTGDQESCVKVGRHLMEFGYSTDLIHGDLTQGNRNRVIREFRDGKIRILVATDMLARGLDVPHVDHVINFDLPFEYQDFLHRIGRTARAGRRGEAITFVCGTDQKKYNKVKPYLVGAKEIMVDPNFKFIDRNDKYEPKKNKPTEGGPAKPKHKPVLALGEKSFKKEEGFRKNSKFKKKKK